MGFKDIAKGIGVFIKDAYLERKEHEEEQYRIYSRLYSGAVWVKEFDMDDIDSGPYFVRREEYDEDLERGFSADALRREYRLHKASIYSSLGRARAFEEALQRRGMTKEDLKE